MKWYLRQAVCHTMSVSVFDVPYLTHFQLLVGILCHADITSQWKRCSPATFFLEPGMDSPMKVQGQFQMSSRSQVSTDNLLVLYFILQSIDGTGSPAHLLSQYMQGFICPSKVVYEGMVFNMGTHEQVINHGRAVNDMAKHLSSNEAQC